MGEAIERVDAVAPPAWFSLSCVHPDVATLALAHASPAAVGRLREVKANASRRPTAELVELRHLDAGDPHEWATAMTTLHERFGVPVLGGCCGTDDRHLTALARLLTSAG